MLPENGAPMFEDIWTFFTEQLLPYWPLVTVATVLYIAGEFFKRYVWTKEKAAAKGGAWLWARRTLPFHPMVGGALIGVVWQDPQRGVEGLVPSMGYFLGAGVLAVVAFNVLRQILKDKYDLKVEIFADSLPPPSGPNADVPAIPQPPPLP